MFTIPPQLHTNKIRQFIHGIIEDKEINNFFALDDIQQDKFVSLCIGALDCDVDVILSKKGNKHLIKYLMSYDGCEKQDIIDAIRESAAEQFSFYFDKLLMEYKQ